MTAQMAVTDSVPPNCKFKITFTMTVPELGLTAGLFIRLAVVDPTPSGLERNMILVGLLQDRQVLALTLPHRIAFQCSSGLGRRLGMRKGSGVLRIGAVKRRFRTSSGRGRDS
jgi:hypothetical protein